MSPPRHNNWFRQQSGPAPAGTPSPGGALNQLGAMKMGSRSGQCDVWELSAAPSAFSSFHSLLLPFRRSCRISVGVEVLSPAHVTCEGAFVHIDDTFRLQTTEGPGGFEFTHMFSCCMGNNWQWFTEQIQHGLTQRLRSVEAEA